MSTAATVPMPADAVAHTTQAVMPPQQDTMMQTTTTTTATATTTLKESAAHWTTNMTASSLTAPTSMSGGNSCLDEQIERLKRCEYLREGEVKALCLRAREILVDESNVQRVDAPVTVRIVLRANMRVRCVVFLSTRKPNFSKLTHSFACVLCFARSFARINHIKSNQYIYI